METRATIEAVLDRAYAARRADEPAAVAACFCEDGHFKANGWPAAATTRTERDSAVKDLFAAFALLEFKLHCRIIDPPRAAVHWRGTFRAPNGNVGEADILDLIEVRDGKLASLTTFFDTAYAAAIAAPA